MLKPTSRIIIAAALSAGAVMANPAYAVAASYTPEGVCGAGFARVNDGSRVVKTSTGRVYGRVYLLYNRRTGFNCVTTIKSSFTGSATRTVAQLQVKGGGTKGESGAYKYYAGPVKLYGKGHCVKYWGAIRPNGHDPRVASGGRTSWGNCG
ncbi:hypothetical protein [Streptosporangium pseudovulgare]|uniref:Spore-associated protein A n=1 Tax=Streptosporangium pseudovulgare TaxID=35765 RepID=A0ABQ2QMU8_9ACTN|nr:hypothetical protein [Streptosporangium pseudovulgare]GGP85718.1 hypothetical protein GCM10010140_13850 [Streptosporangium pseudovulgare]